MFVNALMIPVALMAKNALSVLMLLLPDVIANEVGELVADTRPTVGAGKPRPSIAVKFAGVTTGTSKVMPMVSGVLVPAALLAVTCRL